jgi:hypothetical protein
VLVVDALLHPRATNLPPHVQSAYIQSAMKVCHNALLHSHRIITDIHLLTPDLPYPDHPYLSKVFVRACTDCTDGEIASLVGIARSRLGVFLQVSQG